MAAIKPLNIPLVVTFNDKGAKQAASSLGTLESLAKKVVGVLSVAALSEFGRKAIEMASAQNAAFAQLNNTLKNIGLGYGINQVNDLISKFSEATGVAKEQLIPAYQTLAVATGSVSEAQNSLQTALDVSAGTGNDLITVSDALSKAYLGNYKALGQLNAGMTAASLKGKNMAQILAQLNQTYAGAASTAANTFAGKMKIVKNAIDEATVSIGTGLINSLNNLTSGTGVDSLSGQIKGLGDSIRYTLEGYTQALKDIANFPIISVLKNVVGFLSLGLKEDIQAYKDLGKNSEQKFQPLSGVRAVQTAIDVGKAERLAKEQALQRAKAQAQITASQQKSLELQKAQAVLSTAGRVTDLQQIEIIAALMQTHDQQTIDRLNLQKALLDQNTTAAGDLAQKVLAANLAALQSTAIDPFGNWITSALAAINSIKDLQAQLAKLGSATISAPTVVSTTTAAAVTAADIINGTGYVSSQGVSSNDPNAGTFAQYYQGTSGGLYGSTPVNVVVSVDKSGNLIANVQNGLNQATANGSPNNINRLNYNFNN